MRLQRLCYRLIYGGTLCGFLVFAAPIATRAQEAGGEATEAGQDVGAAEEQTSEQAPAETAAEVATEEKPTEEKPTEESPAEEQPAEAEQGKPAEENKAPTAEQSAAAEDQPAEGEKQPEKPKKPTPPPPPPEPRKLPKLGSSDGPMLPGQPWRVHDYLRPRPPVVAPPQGEVIAPPPGDAQVLFDGTDLSMWAHHDREDPSVFIEPQWEVKEGYFQIKRGGGDLFTLDTYGDVQLHLEWATPDQPRGDSQGRGNSGIKFLGLYEVQILDSYKNLTYADGQAAAVYGQYPPDVNVSRPPGEWQTYDIIFEIPRFEGEKVVSPGYLTVLHNGVLVHLRRELSGTTGLRSPGKYATHPPAGPIMLQDHGNPIRFRNIWVRRLDR